MGNALCAREVSAFYAYRSLLACDIAVLEVVPASMLPPSDLKSIRRDSCLHLPVADDERACLKAIS
jgi:hypothetical protein